MSVAAIAVEIELRFNVEHRSERKLAVNPRSPNIASLIPK